MGRATFTDHEGNEVPDIEVEEIDEEEEGKGKGKDKPSKKEPDDDDDGLLDDEEARAAKRRSKADDDDDDEEIEDEEDDKSRELAETKAENDRLRAEAHKQAQDKAEGDFEQAKYLSGALDKEIKAIREQIVKAKTDEDTEAVAKLEQRLEEAKEAKEKTDKLLGEAERKFETLKQGGGQQQRGGGNTPKANEWMGQNAWMRDPRYAVEANAVMVIDKQLASEGLNPNSAEYFRKLSQRLAKKFPDLKVKHLDGKRVVTSERKPGRDSRKSVHGQQGTRGSEGNRRPDRPTFTTEDRAKMRRFGLDPNDKNAVKHWLRSKAEVAAQEARRNEE